jgi:ethanolaminephosphotransferase
MEELIPAQVTKVGLGFNADIEQLQLKHFAFWVIVFLVVCTQLPISLYRVYQVCKKKKISFLTAISNLCPFLGLCLFGGIWITSPVSLAMKEHTVPLYISLGLVFAKLTTRVIIAHVASLKFPFLYGYLIPVIIGSILSNSFRIGLIL